MTTNRQADKAPPAAPSGYLLAAAVLLLAAPLSLPAWTAGTLALRYGARRAVLAAAGVVPGVVAAWLLGPAIAAKGAAAALAAVATAGAVRPSTALLGAFAAAFARWAVVTAPLGIPAGLVAAAIPPGRQQLLPNAEWDARERRARERSEVRQRRRVAKRADREGANPRSNALAVSLGGMVASWRIGDLVVPPAGQLGLAWLLVGAPGAGKTTAIERLAYLAGLERRHLVVLDAKGGHDGLAAGVVAAYRAGWAASGGGDAPTVRLFPQERLDIWRGDPQAIVNRLVEVWEWGREPYWREVATVALRMALGQPGPPCRSGQELVRRLQPSALARAWDHDPDVRALVQDMTKKGDLGGVHVRVMNLIASLGGALDGEHSWEDADCWVVTVPAMVATSDADSCLRVLLSDYGHFTMSPDRKGARPSTLIVDEFSAIAGGRRSAIHLLERGRGAGAGVVLAAQSAVALGNEEERARLLAAASCILLFRTPQPAELAALAGTERVAEGAWSFSTEEFPQSAQRVTVTTRARARVDQDQVRQLPTGEADLIVRGLAERVRIIRTAIPAAMADQARALVAGEDRPPIAGTLHPATPADAVATRVSGPPSSPQERRRPKSRPAASALDPTPSSPIRRYRPPGAGTDSSPGGDRD